MGGGLMGTETAYAAARIGGAAVTVDLYEADQIGHEGGASIDGTRLFRHAYGEWSHYTRWAAEAFPLWRDLERQSDRTLYVQTGSVWAAHGEDHIGSRRRWPACSSRKTRAHLSKAATRQ